LFLNQIQRNTKLTRH